MDTDNLFGTERVGRILLKIAPPVMLAQLIQALYNIVDSFFVGRYSQTGLTALSIVYPLQLLMIALAVGTGVGINTRVAFYLGLGERDRAEQIAGLATRLGLALWAVFAAVCCLLLPAYARLSTQSETIIRDVVLYGRIVCAGSIGLFLESVWTKVIQADGDMRTPMLAQIVGAATNIALDPVLIWGLIGLPRMGIAGAAVATVLGQVAAALIVRKKGCRPAPPRAVWAAGVRAVYRAGIPNILMQSAYTFYIFGLNLVLAGFSDQAVTALGIYYKWQTLIFIPLGSMQTCIVPVISYNLAAGRVDRCRKTLSAALMGGMGLISLGTLAFWLIPEPLLRVFTSDPRVIAVGGQGFPLIGSSFVPMVSSLLFPVFFQAIGRALVSSLLTVLRTVVLFVPLGFLFSRLGLAWFWVAFPVTEVTTSAVGLACYRRQLRAWQRETRAPQPAAIE